MLAPNDRHDSPSDQPLVCRLQDILTSIAKEIECGNIGQTESLVSELVKFLDSISDSTESVPSNDDIKNNAYEVLSAILNFVSSPSLDQEIIDTLSFELPKAVTRLAGVSSSCSEIVNSVIDRFVATCSPRDMLSILCEALDSLIKTTKESNNFVPLLSGLSKVLLFTQRRHFEQVKVAVPVILKVLNSVSSESDDENTEPLFDRAIGIADSIRAVCSKLDGAAKEMLCALLGLYVLQIMVHVSISMKFTVSKCVPLVSKLSNFFPFCHLSYLGLITASEVDTMTNMIVGEDEDDYKSCISYVEQGASLSVIWGHASDLVAQAAEENLASVKNELKSNQTKKWQAIGMLKHILSSGNLPWDFKEHAINFLLDITDENISQENGGDHNDFSSYMPSVFAALQAVATVVIYSPSSVLRKKTYEAFKRVVAEIPRSEKHDFLKAMIINCNSPSMVAILLDLVRKEVLRENQQRISIRNQVLPAENLASANALFWPPVVLELVDLVLRPQKGGPPLLPEHGDAVLSALNLYRFVLLTTSKVCLINCQYF
ncbi:aberrant root formation protein 4 isoform X2 [Mangifera indica]|uniref:aberrant root formation protein 4 isoform X2 n=1 Tax=Mangifera indica TaxID=29780 RepID=UPI001CFC34DF|nr:aberrant root formation protein 4 isoform X2 [Mangifera indica]